MKNGFATNTHNRKLPYGKVINVSFLEAGNHGNMFKHPKKEKKNPLNMFLGIFPLMGVRTAFPLTAASTIHVLRSGPGLIADEGYKFCSRAQAPSQARLPRPHPPVPVGSGVPMETLFIPETFIPAQAPHIKTQLHHLLPDPTERE